MAVQINPKTGKVIAKRFSGARLMQASESYHGFCIACGATRECCEPDARKYDCEKCGRSSVYGAEEIILMGLVKGDRRAD